jgi:hypothetical protein
MASNIDAIRAGDLSSVTGKRRSYRRRHRGQSLSRLGHIGTMFSSPRSAVMPAFARVSAAVLCLSVVAACGGKGSNGSTTTPTTPSTPTTPTNTWSAAGQIVANGTGQGVGGATVTPGWSLAAVTADAQGNYQLGDVANPPSTPYPVTMSASGFVDHGVWITWARGPRTDVNFDLIRNAAPFSMDFYQQLVRDTYDRDAGYPFRTLRWTSAPSFYVKTVDQNGRAVEPEVLAVTLDALRRAVPAWTSNTYNAVTIETGTESRDAPAGWINVLFRREPNVSTPCGQSYVGRDPGEITLWEDVCSCGSIKVPGAVTLHEVGHAMGFFHVSDRSSVMFPYDSGTCARGALSAAEAYHAAIAYSRPRGNTDPDKDPSGAAAFGAGRDLGGPLVR